MLRYYLNRFLCILMALLLAISLMGVLFSSMLIGMFRSNSFVQFHCNRCSDAIIADIELSSTEAAVAASLPEDAFAGAVNQENFGTVSTEIARMFSFRYTADYSESSNIYTLFYHRLTEYDNKNGLGLTQEQLESDASLAVNYMNSRFSGKDTQNVKLFNLAYSDTVLYVLIGCAVGIVVSNVALGLLNRGRHRKFSYIGMGFTVAGYCLTFVTLFVLRADVLQNYRFCVYQPYDDMMRLCHETLLHWLMLSGIPLVIAGFAMLIANYRYYAKKLKKARASREDYDRFKEDYMDVPKPSRVRQEGEELERHVMKIDFEEE